MKAFKLSEYLFIMFYWDDIGGAKMNIKDVAKKAGVSVVTVSRVINGVSTVRKNNRDKVIRAMEELNYQPNHAARVLASGKTRVIGLTIGSLNDTFLEGVVKAINEKLVDYGYVLALSVVPIGSKDSFLFQKERVDGVILLCPTDEEAMVKQLEKQGIPYVLIDNQDTHDVVSVVVDNVKGGYDATKHLLDLGHKKIGHIAGPSIYLSSREREKGYKDALQEAGLKPYVMAYGDFRMDDGFTIVKEWIAEDTLPTAIFAADDFIALGAINALMDSGYRVPEDVSIIGYDDQAFASQYVPKITTVKQPAQAMGEKGVDLLMRLIKRKPMKQKQFRLQPNVIIRQSTKKSDG